MKQLRQGDILIEKMSDKPDKSFLKKNKNLQLRPDKIILEGEISNNFHMLQGNGEVYLQQDRWGDLEGTHGFLLLSEQAQIVHGSKGDPISDEMNHDALKLDVGTYRIIRQRENDKYVMD